MKPKHTDIPSGLSELKFYEYVSMRSQTRDFDVVIVGGSYAGLSAALTLGRALRSVLVIDKGDGFLQQDIYAHNFITQDGVIASAIHAKAKEQVLQYKTVKFYKDKVETVVQQEGRFIVETRRKEKFTARKILFATGLIDVFPPINGFRECWGQSVLHCPYCNGYEYADADIGIFANGDIAYDLAKTMYNWSRHLSIFTNGKSTISALHTEKLAARNVLIEEGEIDFLDHRKGQLKSIVLKSGKMHALNALFCKPGNLQATDIPVQQLGCACTAEGFIKTDIYHRTSVSGVYSAGDNTVMPRAISVSVASGTEAGMSINKEIIEESF